METMETVQNIQPAEKDGFSYSGELYAVTAGHKVHRRATVAELKSLFMTQDDTEYPKHWYEAQLMHYGLKPSRSKSTAKMRLFEFVVKRCGQVAVPAEVQQIEVELKAEWNRRVRIARSRKMQEKKRLSRSIWGNGAAARHAAAATGKAKGTGGPAGGDAAINSSISAPGGYDVTLRIQSAVQNKPTSEQAAGKHQGQCQGDKRVPEEPAILAEKTPNPSLPKEPPRGSRGGLSSEASRVGGKQQGGGLAKPQSQEDHRYQYREGNHGIRSALGHHQPATPPTYGSRHGSWSGGPSREWRGRRSSDMQSGRLASEPFFRPYEQSSPSSSSSGSSFRRSYSSNSYRQGYNTVGGYGDRTLNHLFH